MATIDVLEGQFEKYDDLPDTVGELGEFCSYKDKSWIDRDGRLRWRNGEPSIAFGQKSGMTLKELARQDAKYLRWMLKADFSDEVKSYVKSALSGNFPNQELVNQLSKLQ